MKPLPGNPLPTGENREWQVFQPRRRRKVNLASAGPGVTWSAGSGGEISHGRRALQAWSAAFQGRTSDLIKFMPDRRPDSKKLLERCLSLL
jgi:hypothetical protein